jgi:hypothetical protein
MNKTVREASKIGPCAEHSRHPSIEAIDAAENHSGLVEMPASRSNGRKLLLTSDGGQRPAPIEWSGGDVSLGMGAVPA